MKLKLNKNNNNSTTATSIHYNPKSSIWPCWCWCWGGEDGALVVFTSYCAAVLRGLRGEAVAESTYSGTGEPSRDSDSGVTSPLIPMCDGEAGADLLLGQRRERIQNQWLILAKKTPCAKKSPIRHSPTYASYLNLNLILNLSKDLPLALSSGTVAWKSKVFYFEKKVSISVYFQ